MKIRYSKKRIENVSMAYAKTIEKLKKIDARCLDEIPRCTFVCSISITPTPKYQLSCSYCPYHDWNFGCGGLGSVAVWTQDWIAFLSSHRRTIRTSNALAESILSQAMIAESEEVLQWLEGNMPCQLRQELLKSQKENNEDE